MDSYTVSSQSWVLKMIHNAIHGYLKENDPWYRQRLARRQHHEATLSTLNKLPRNKLANAIILGSTEKGRGND